jgi:serine/threonine-protein kinase RsbW
METVEIEFTPLPAHVRTARLVASAVARQCGVDEAVLDEVRLAVGEACSRAVELHAQAAPKVPVSLVFADAPGRFIVSVRDRLPEPPDQEPVETEIRLAVLTGLVDDLEIEKLDGGSEITMSWPATGRLRTGVRPPLPRSSPVTG